MGLHKLFMLFHENDCLGCLDMPLFLIFGRHHAESCPANNEKTRKVAMEYFSKEKALLKKHGIKSLGSWTVIGEHLMVMVLEAPSSDAILKFMMEPELMAISASETMEVKMAVSNEEIAKMLKLAK